MRKAWIGHGLRAVAGYAVSVFFGSETVKGWMGAPSEWMASFAGWPLYSAFSVLAIGLFILASIQLFIVVNEWLDGVWRRHHRKEVANRDSLISTMENAIDLLEGRAFVDPIERTSMLDLCRHSLGLFDLAAPSHMDAQQSVMHYRRILPYLRLSVERAQEAVRSWKVP